MVVMMEVDGKTRRLSPSYANRVSPHPSDTSLQKDYAISRYMIHGLTPQIPFVNQKTPIVAFGSCFAENISKYLVKRGFNVTTKREGKAYVTRMGDGMVHTHAIRQQFEWAWENRQPAGEPWIGFDDQNYGHDEEARLETKALFDEADLFIITLGLSEIWFDKVTGEVLWRVPPKDKIDPDRHQFRVASFAETLENLHAIRDLIRKHRREASIVITVSPIPLAASFRNISCIAANAASKAIIRAAVDEFYRAIKPEDSNLFYFPSYEIVTCAFNNPWLEDRRHVYGHVLNFNMKVFEHYFCGTISHEEVLKSYRVARRRDEKVGKLGHAALAATTEAKRERLREERRAQRRAEMQEARRKARAAIRAN